MNRLAATLLLVFCACTLSFGAAGTPSGTVITNYSQLHFFYWSTAFTNYIMDTSLTMGSIYGIDGIYSLAAYNGYPDYSARIDLYITNLGNDADNDATLFVSSFSNSPGYPGSPWTYHFEVAAADVGTNYAIPFALFGVGAIFHAVLVVDIPADAPTNTMGYFTIGGTTLSNSNHIAGTYTGYNGISYGGETHAGTSFTVRVIPPNQIVDLYASDAIDTITIFNATQYLRKIDNFVYAVLRNTPVRAATVNLWYAVDSLPDGAGGNPADASVPMAEVSPNLYKAKIPEDAVKSGNYTAFFLEIDGLNYLTNYTYLLKGIYEQGYETIVMNNIIPPGSAYIKLPEKTLGKPGKITVYSIAGDIVRHVYEGEIGNTVYGWDGTDDQGILAQTGIYFIVVDVENLKEVRKIMVK